MNKYLDFINQRKEGIIVGGLIGLVTALKFKDQPFFSHTATAAGAIDPMLIQFSSDVPSLKYMLFLIMLGIMIGIIIQKVVLKK